MQSRAQREDGEVFLAEICFSTYRTNSGSRLAAMILDSSEDLRSREEASLHQMLAGSRIAVGRSRMKSAMCAAPSRSCIRTSRALNRSATAKTLRPWEVWCWRSSALRRSISASLPNRRPRSISTACWTT